MRTELYSLRSSAEEISYINDNLRSVVSAVSDKANIKILFKTEIDRDPRKLKANIFESYETPNPPELQLFVNALDTQDNTSFLNLFRTFLEAMEKEIIKADPIEYRRRKLLPQIKVHTLDNLPGGYPAYYFMIKRRKFLVLPRISLVDMELTDYIAQVVNIAKDKFYEAQKICPDGYIYYKKENKKTRDRFDSCFDTEEKEENTQYITQILADAPEVLFEETFYNTAQQQAAKAKAEAEEKNEATAEEETKEKAKTKTNAESESETKNEQDILCIADGDVVSILIDDDDEVREKGFKAFLRKIFPVRGDSPKEIIRKIVLILAVIAFFTGAFLLLKFYVLDPAKNNADISEIQEIFYAEVDSTDDEATTDEVKPSRNWAGLKKVNEDIVGWIKIDNTKIDYPVLWYKGDNEDFQYYIYRNYKKEYSTFGSIFVDYRCKEGPADRNVILHGHNMGSDSSMFATLTKYASKEGWTQGNTDYYKKNAIVHFDTPELDGDWIIFSVMKVDVSNSNKYIFNYLQTEFTSDSQFMNFVYNTKMRSYLKVDVPINENDRLLTLSTCSYESKNMRTVVVARKIRPDEDVTKYIAKVKKTSPYSTVYSTFRDELEAERISWYDGSATFNERGELQFLPEGKTYTVTFLDGRGEVFATQKILKGQNATVPIGTPPGQPSDGEYYYKFIRWEGNLNKVTSDRIIQAIYEKVKIPTPIQEPTEATVPVETTPPSTTPQPTTPPPTTPPPTEAPTPPPEVTDPPEEPAPSDDTASQN